MSTTRQPRFFEMNRYTSVIHSLTPAEEAAAKKKAAEAAAAKKAAPKKQDKSQEDKSQRQCLNCWGLCDSGGTCETIWQTITCCCN